MISIGVQLFMADRIHPTEAVLLDTKKSYQIDFEKFGKRRENCHFFAYGGPLVPLQVIQWDPALRG